MYSKRILYNSLFGVCYEKTTQPKGHIHSIIDCILHWFLSTVAVIEPPASCPPLLHTSHASGSTGKDYHCYMVLLSGVLRPGCEYCWGSKNHALRTSAGTFLILSNVFCVVLNSIPKILEEKLFGFLPCNYLSFSTVSMEITHRCSLLHYICFKDKRKSSEQQSVSKSRHVV